jgi:hypothetical protein
MVSTETGQLHGSLEWKGQSYRIEGTICSGGQLSTDASDPTWVLDQSTHLDAVSGVPAPRELLVCAMALAPPAWVGYKEIIHRGRKRGAPVIRVVVVTPDGVESRTMVSSRPEGAVEWRSVGDDPPVVIRLRDDAIRMVGFERSIWREELEATECRDKGTRDIDASATLLERWQKSRGQNAPLASRGEPGTAFVATFSGDNKGRVVVLAYAGYKMFVLRFASGESLFAGQPQTASFCTARGPNAGEEISVPSRVRVDTSGKCFIDTPVGTFELWPDEMLQLGLGNWVFHDQTPRPDTLEKALKSQW